SSISGKMLTPAFPSSRRQKPNTQSYSSQSLCRKEYSTRFLLCFFLADDGPTRSYSPIAGQIDLPGYQLTYAARAAALGQLGECERAKDQLSQLIALLPDAAQSVRLELGKWYQPDLVEHWVEGLRKAGPETPEV